jgi:hypothetical protein
MAKFTREVVRHGQARPRQCAYLLHSRHNLIKYEASLSRHNAFFGDNHSFNASIYAAADSTARNPCLAYLSQYVVLVFNEAALFFPITGDPLTGLAPAAHVDSFFEQECLLYKRGWRLPAARSRELELAELTASALKLAFSSQGLPGTPGR